MQKIILACIFAALLSVPVYISHLSRLSENKRKEMATETAIKKYGFHFTEVSKQSGVDFIHHSPVLDPLIDPILPQIASMGASVSVCDFDEDGWNDFYVTNSCFGYKNALYHNQKDGSFIDVAEKMGLADLNIEGKGVSMGAVWADYDNDGYEDLFLYKWGRPELFKNKNGTGFINVTAQSGLPTWINANTAIWFDYNSDGLVDLFIGGYYREDIDLWHLKTTKILTESFEYSQNGGRSYLFKNNGNGTFTDVTSHMGLTSTRWTLAAGAADVNFDGYPELFIANDYGINEFYFNDKGKRFTEQEKNVLIGLTPKSGMNVCFGDTYNKGQFGIYVSNITEPGILLQGNNFWMPYKDNEKLLYINSAGESGVEAGGWSYGAQFGDFNNDGFIDLYVANGYISGTNKKSYWYDYSKVTGGNAAIISDINNWPAMKGRSQSGFQQNKIWLNDGTSHFTDVAKYVTDKEEYDSRAVAVADLWNRGALDLIVSNQNNKLLIYKNIVNTDNHWIAFELEGTISNKSAIGAIVTLYWESKTQSQIVTGGIGFCSQNQRSLHFGLGKSSKVDKALITWPNGHSQVIEQPLIDRLNKIKEIQ
jgi:enediyne biosynthesis protein E4